MSSPSIAGALWVSPATGLGHVSYRDGQLQLSAARGRLDASGVDLD